MKILRHMTGAGLALLICLAAGGCLYDGGGIDNPFVRTARWFSFVGGDDIRAACRSGGADRYRAVYIGMWRKQVRIYEFGVAGPNVLDQRVIDEGNLVSITTDDLLAPWRGKAARRVLDPSQAGRLAASFAVLADPPPVGLRLPSDGYYWTAVGCVGGRFRYNAWLFPSTRFDRLTFPGALLALDQTGEPYVEPSPFGYVDQYDQRHLAAERWFIEVGATGFSSAGRF